MAYGSEIEFFCWILEKPLPTLVLSACPKLAAEEVRDIIRKTARPVDDLIGRPPRSHSKFVGFGCVNAAAAVERALEICGGP
jgi:hypothetical protein